MKNTLLVMFSLAAAQVLHSQDLKFLRAIAEVESGNDPRAVGKAGEVTAYQIMPENWVRCTSMPIQKASNPAIAKVVALRHLRWLRTTVSRIRPELTDANLESPYFLAVLWHRGPYATRAADAATHNYAMRVVEIYSTL